MGRKVTSRKRKNNNQKILFYVLLPLLGLGIVLSVIGHQMYFASKAQELKNIIVLQPNPDVARPNLQLRTFPFITVPPGGAPPVTQKDPTPTPPLASPSIPGVNNPPVPGNYCPLDDLKPSGNTCSCLDSNAVACPAPSNPTVGIPSCTEGMAFRLPPGTGGKWYCVTIGNPGLMEPNPPAPPAGCSAACIAKPVVYLYPTEKTLVDVSVTTPGEIFVSDPLYPAGGWKDVEAHPDGTLYYQGKQYTELFYESTVVGKIPMPKQGIIIPIKNIEPELRRITTQLGLINHEQREFLEFWVPVLQKQNAPYIYFSILPPEVKAKHDTLHVYPEPDTRIEFIAYFKGLQKPMKVEPLQLPQTPPERIGFTEVEWGGTIGQ